jgi:hypothetical protein
VAGTGQRVSAVLLRLAAALLAWVYVGYPAAAWVRARSRPFVIRAEGPGVRRVTIGIAVHDEASQVEERVADALAQALDAELEVIVASDGSTDETDALVEAIAAREPRVRLLALPRGGQTAAQNAILAAATGDVLVLTDAGTRFAPGCVAALVRPFADRRVGCATGVLRWRNVGSSRTSEHEGAYWRYEQLVRRLESRAGWLSAGTGALLATRVRDTRPVDPTVSFDHSVPLQAREQGRKVVVVPEAVATDEIVADPRAQFRARTRTATRGITANLAVARGLPPWRHPEMALAVWSHKLLRWATPLLALVAVLAAARRGAHRDPLAALTLGSAASVPALALVDEAARRHGRGSRLGAAARTFIAVNLAFLVAWGNVLRGRRIHHWHGADWRARHASGREERGAG